MILVLNIKRKKLKIMDLTPKEIWKINKKKKKVKNSLKRRPRKLSE